VLVYVLVDIFATPKHCYFLGVPKHCEARSQHQTSRLKKGRRRIVWQGMYGCVLLFLCWHPLLLRVDFVCVW
jgi:hypothetical protein